MKNRNDFTTSLFILLYGIYLANATTTKPDPKTVNIVLKTEIDVTKNKNNVLKTLQTFKNLINSIKRDIISRRHVGRARNIWNFAAKIGADNAVEAIQGGYTRINDANISTTITTTTEAIDKEQRGSAQFWRPYSYYMFDVFDAILSLNVGASQPLGEKYFKAISAMVEGEMKEQFTSMLGEEVLKIFIHFLNDMKGILEPIPYTQIEFNFLNRKLKHSDTFNQLMNFIDTKGTMEDITRARKAIQQLKNKTATIEEIVHHICEDVFIKPYMKLTEPEKGFIKMTMLEFVPEKKIGRHNFKHYKTKHRFKIIPQTDREDRLEHEKSHKTEKNPQMNRDVSIEYKKKHKTTVKKYNNLGKSTKALQYSKTKKPNHQNIIKDIILNLFSKKQTKEPKARKKIKRYKPYRRTAANTRDDLTTIDIPLVDKVNKINKNNIEEILNTGKLTAKTQTSTETLDNDVNSKVITKKKLKPYRRFDTKNFHFSDVSLDVEGLAHDLEHGNDDGARVLRATDDVIPRVAGGDALSSNQDTSFWDHTEFMSKEEDYLGELRQTPAGFPPWLLVSLTTNATTATVNANGK